MDSCTQDETTGQQRNRNVQGRRGWSKIEEEVLAEGMKKIIREGWKSENGFKTGYLTLLEGHLKKWNADCTLKAEPHITSRLTVWKKNYNTLFEILSNTGVGMDSGTHMIEATDEQWEGFIRKDLNARLMRQKSWPLYKDWCEIFGMTRATGAGAQDHKNAQKAPPTVGMETASNPINLDNEAESESHNFNGHMGESSGVGKKGGKRKRNGVEKPDPFMNIMNHFCETASTRLGEIAQRIGYEQDMSVARKRIYEVVSKMDCMTKKEKYRVTQLITRNPKNLDVFFSLPDEDRVEWTLMVLNGEFDDM